MKEGDSLSPTLFNLAFQKGIQSLEMAPSGIKMGKEQLNALAYADDIVLIGKGETEIRHPFVLVEIENIARKSGLQINHGKTKYVVVEQKNRSKQNKIGQLTIKDYTLERVENFEYLNVILNEDNNHQISLQERIKNANKTYFLLQKSFSNNNISKNLKLRQKNTLIDKTLTFASETWRDRKQTNIF